MTTLEVSLRGAIKSINNDRDWLSKRIISTCLHCTGMITYNTVVDYFMLYIKTRKIYLILLQVMLLAKTNYALIISPMLPSDTNDLTLQSLEEFSNRGLCFRAPRSSYLANLQYC